MTSCDDCKNSISKPFFFYKEGHSIDMSGRRVNKIIGPKLYNSVNLRSLLKEADYKISPCIDFESKKNEFAVLFFRVLFTHFAIARGYTRGVSELVAFIMTSLMAKQSFINFFFSFSLPGT